MCQVSKKKFRTEYEHLGRVLLTRPKGALAALPERHIFTEFATEGPVQKAAAAAAAEAAAEKR